MDAVSAAARPWIEAAKPSYPCLIDNDHRVADLYHMVNVPQAVWIDETGHIVRPTESAGAYEGFRAMDRTTRKVPDEVAAITSLAKRTYVEAVRDWVVRGSASIHAFRAGGRHRPSIPPGRDRRAGARALSPGAAPAPARPGRRRAGPVR